MNSNSTGCDMKLSYVPVVAALLVLSGCSNSPAAQPEYAGICVDEATHMRIDDDKCGDYTEHGHSVNSGSYVMWFSTNTQNGTRDYHVPGVGHNVISAPGHRMTVPAGKTAVKGVPTTGGYMNTIVTRGGFGVSSSIGGKAAS